MGPVHQTPTNHVSLPILTVVIAPVQFAVAPIIMELPLLFAQPLRVAAFVFVAYISSLVIYRLYLSPLARFPGPRLAAATAWYEFYHDAIRHGKYTFEIKRMHEQYGMD